MNKEELIQLKISVNNSFGEWLDYYSDILHCSILDRNLSEEAIKQIVEENK